MDQIQVEAPASSANLGPGFDAFAIAHDSPTDKVTVRLGERRTTSSASVKIGRVTGLDVPSTETENGAGIVCLEMAKSFGVNREIIVDIDKRVPIGLGMGSSGASAAASAFAMDKLLRLGLSPDELIFYAGMGEGATSGSVHYDNVAASILGGFVVVRVGDKGRPVATRFDPPQGLAVCVATPVVALPSRKTEYARSLLPSSVSLETLVTNVANASLMVSGFAKKDIKLIGEGMTDKAVEPARKSMIPGYARVRSAAIKAGAEGVWPASGDAAAVVERRRMRSSSNARKMS